RHSGDILAGKADRPGNRARNDAQERALARPRGPEQAGEPPAVEHRADIIKDAECTIALADAGDLNPDHADLRGRRAGRRPESAATGPAGKVARPVYVMFFRV